MADHPDQISCLESIGRFLTDHVPEPWEWIHCIGELRKTSIGLESVYQPVDPRKEPEPFDIEDASTDWQLALCFRRLAELLESDESKRFRRCHFRIHKDGKYRADYEY